MQKIGAISKSPKRYQQLSTIAFAICVSVRCGIIDYGAKIIKKSGRRPEVWRYGRFIHETSKKTVYVNGNMRIFPNFAVYNVYRAGRKRGTNKSNYLHKINYAIWQGL